jgi:hypothetical protein
MRRYPVTEDRVFPVVALGWSSAALGERLEREVRILTGRDTVR